MIAAMRTAGILMLLAFANADWDLGFNVDSNEEFDDGFDEDSSDPNQPTQVHLSYGEKSNDIMVTWSTDAETESIVHYDDGKTKQTASGSSSKFVYGDHNGRIMWIHRVTLKDLKFDQSYTYTVGSKKGWSANFSFKTTPSGEGWVLRTCLFGDLGVVNARSLPHLKTDVSQGMYDLILHIGDFAYNMYECSGSRGNKFMRMIEPLAASMPYMTCPGNHEIHANFSHYKHRFSMPGENSFNYYSFDVGLVHFISISTEVYYTKYSSKAQIATQYNWLRRDLEEATKPENRKQRPWIMIFGHRPMVCSNKFDDCPNLKLPNRIHLEPLLKEFGVDLVLWAHEHSYERTWPLYDLKVYNGSYEHPYVNPKAPIHVITGSAGCRENTDPFKKTPYPWSAFRSSDYGYTRMNVYNRTHIYFEQLAVSSFVTYPGVIDKFWVIKEKHEPYSNL